MSKLTYLIVGVVAAVIFVCVAAPVIMVAGIASTCAPATLTASSAASGQPWDAEQVANAKTIIEEAVQRQIPVRGRIIALATAMQESQLRNLPHLGQANDHDSVGLFQQRPSQGWGTPEQLANPTYAAGRFYDKLITISGWESMLVWQAAQRVQGSADPQAYDKWEDEATQLALQLATDPALCTAPVGPGGWLMPVDGPIVSGFRTAQRPSHDGIDIAAPKGRPIRAAAAGVVIKVRCNASLGGQPYSCDQDGSPTVAGCGWFVELRSGNIIHRYCHQLIKPDVVIGQQVAAGQIIGVVGSSGHSSGPHLHFEVHDVADGGGATSENALNPSTFLRRMGVPVPE